MKFINYIYFFIFLFQKSFSSFIRINATNDIKFNCENGLFIIDFKVDFSSPLEDYYSFDLNLEFPDQLKFKCLIEYQNSTINCISNLNSNKCNLGNDQLIQFQNTFPKVKGIIWDYDSFVKNVYGKYFVFDYNCEQKKIENSLDKINIDEYGLIFNISSIYKNKCSYSTNIEENKYYFSMKLNILDGYLKNQLEQINTEKGDIGFIELEFLQEIFIPLLFGNNINYLKELRKSVDFPFAFCNYKEKISNLNINNLIKDGIDFDCYIPIPEDQLMIGIIQIKPFYDQIYIKINKDTQTSEIILVNFYFNINRTIELIDNEKNENFLGIRIIDEIIDNNTDIEENNETNNKELNDNKESQNNNSTINNNDINNINKTEEKKYITINYFLIGNKNDKLYCPDKPIFTIEKLKDIQLKYSFERNYTFFLKGKLSYKFIEEKNILFNQTDKEINFNLQVIDNLAENEDDQKAIVFCVLPNNTFFLNKNIIIYCYGNKLSEDSMKKNDTDITLNWAIEKNRIHENIIIKWPKVKKRIKHMYSYTIKAFSILQKNYGCFNDEFYFYMYIYKLDYEPDILFEIEMRNPKDPRAVCKVHESSILKCYFPLYQQRLLKNTVISLPINITYESRDSRGNKVIFIVDEYDFDYDDFHIVVKETCGDYVFIGALKKAGLSYFIIIMGIIGIGIFIFLFIVCLIFYISYKIKHRNRKGKYFAYIEEGDNSGMKNKNINISSSPRK